MDTILPSQSERIEKLLAEMSLEEKLAQLCGVWLSELTDDKGIPRETIMSNRISQGIGQVSLSAGATELPAEITAQNANAVQRFLRERTRLGIPAIINDECNAGFVGMGATHFPQGIGQGATWNPSMLKQMGDVIRQQARSVGSHLMYSPVFDVGIDPRWGRIEETRGEDPYLCARLGVAFVQGLQSESLHKGVIATLKHFVGYSASEGGRNCAPAHIGSRELREIYLYPFEAGIKEGNAHAVMAAYHDIDGVPCAANRELLTDLLRDTWGFEGIVIADWGVVSMLASEHHIAYDVTDAGKKALAAGLDVEIPFAEGFGAGLLEALRRGEVSEMLLDRAVRRHLRIKMLLGLFEEPFVDVADARKHYDTPKQRSLALELARHSMTLLKNENNLLPLSTQIKSIAVVGPNANNPLCLLGDYSYTIYKNLSIPAVKIVNILDGIRAIVSPETEIIYAPGCDVMGSSTCGFPEAICAAEKADVIVAVVGGQSALHDGGTTGENLDRAEITLPGAQEALLRALHKTGKPIVVILVNGCPLASEWMSQNIQAILEAWLPGEEGGTAVAETLFGRNNPGGKLPVSILRSAGMSPCPYNVRSSSLMPTAKYVFTDRAPLFPFGHGLSYTKFAYDDLTISPECVLDEDVVSISCRVTNIGSIIGDEVIQLYVHDVVASVTRPRKELKGFVRITLAPGESQIVNFMMPMELLALYNIDMRQIVESGVFEVMIGSSSEDIRLLGRFELLSSRPVKERRYYFSDVSARKINQQS